MDFGLYGGHKIIANKWIYRLRDPRRWEVVVFRFYDGGGKPVNYIKRLAGLPGDKGLAIRNGDLYVDGRIEAKPPQVQEAVWIPVYDGRCENPHKPAWKLSGGAAAEGGVWTFPSGAEGRMEWVRPIRNTLPYNQADRDGALEGYAVGDLRLVCSVRRTGPGPALTGAIREEPYTYRFRLGEAARELGPVEEGGEIERRALISPAAMSGSF